MRTLILTIGLTLFSVLVLTASNGVPSSNIGAVDFGKYENVHVEFKKMSTFNGGKSAMMVYELKNCLSVQLLDKRKAYEILKDNGFRFNDGVTVVVKYKEKVLYRL